MSGIHRGQILDHRRIVGFTARIVGDPLADFVTIDTCQFSVPTGRHLITTDDLRASWTPRGADEG